MKKNLFKTVIFILIATACITGGILMTNSCSANTHQDNIPVMEYGDCEQDVNYIDMYPADVQSFVYQDGMFIIEYRDDDAFDIDALGELDEFYRENPEVIIIECSKQDFFDYLSIYSQWYAKYESYEIEVDEGLERDTYKEYKILKQYQIKEIVTPVEGGMNYRYYLVKKE